MSDIQHQTRMTQQRAVILEELRKVKTHPTADELYHIVRKRLPRISLGTVYRNLCFLTECGQIAKLETPGSLNRFDANMEPHQHIRCVSCGCVADIFPPLPAPDISGISVPGFACVTSSRIEYDGLCDECAAAGVSPQDHAYHKAVGEK
ncbi:MAG: transcriptional repressor [Desulfovibrionaceae bacterium]|nr:transcriptional repressor [Desulfovibrionaceae bacterium]